MKIELQKNSKNETIGYTIEGITDDEKHIVNAIRDMHFWGIDEYQIVYNGRTGGCEKWAGTLKFIQKGEKKKK